MRLNIQETNPRAGWVRSGAIRAVRRVAPLVAGLSLLALSIAGPAYAGASSGWIMGFHDGSHYYCVEATVTDAAYSAGYVESNDADSCGQGFTSPSGDLGMELWEYYNGNSCMVYGPYYSDVAEAEYGIGNYDCGTVVDGANYNTYAVGWYWNQGEGSYEVAGNATSPDQTGDVVSAGEPAPTTVTLDGSQVTEGPVPQSAFNGGPLSLSEVPNYLSVSVGNEIVGYTPAVGEIDPTPSAEQTTAIVPVYNASLQTIVGHLVSGEGFVPSPGSGLPSTFPSGVNYSRPFVGHTR
jgi:hypothetical protein